MALLIIGLILFIGIHSVQILAPDFRSGVIATRGDDAWKGIYSVISIAGFVLIIYGYSLTRDHAPVLYASVGGARGLSFILMPIALILLVASQGPVGYIKKAVRHPMLWGVILWAVIHLANNGDAASVLMFGSLLVWAVLDLISCYRRGGTPPKASLAGDIIAVIVGLIVTYVFIRFLHEYLFGVAVM